MYKKFIILAVMILAFLITCGLRVSKCLGADNAESVSPSILYLTSAVTSFAGAIDKVEADSITVSQEAYPQAGGAPVTAVDKTVSAAAAPKPVKITYKVLITQKTNITRPVPTIPYLFKQTKQTQAAGPSAFNPNETITVKDLKVGQYVNINAGRDLRTLKGSQFEAVSINAAPKSISINGRVTDVEGKKIIVKAVSPVGFGFVPGPAAMSAPSPQTPKEEDYTITVDENTEISTYAPSTDPTKPSIPKKLSISDLKKDMQVTVYSDVDFTQVKAAKALLIQSVSAQGLGSRGPVAPAPPHTPAVKK